MRTIYLKVKTTQRNILIGLAVVAVVMVLSFLISFCMFTIQRTIVTNQVKDALVDIASDMEDAKSGGNGYPATIPFVKITNSDKVAFSGGSNIDGSTYCINGTSKQNSTINYYIDSTNQSKTPKEGNCMTKADMPATSVPGGLAVAFASTSDIKIVWDIVPFASGYKMQCSPRQDFKGVKTQSLIVNSGLCQDIKSGVDYYFRVSARSLAGESVWSKTFKVDALR